MSIKKTTKKRDENSRKKGPQLLLLMGRWKSIVSPPSLRLPPPEPDGDGATEARGRAFCNYYYYYYYYYYYCYCYCYYYYC